MKFNYAIAAHPTKYKNVMFHSRLEARWAAFFDLVEWEWSYEPIDLIGWTPDFKLHNLPEIKNAYGVQYIHSPNPFVEIKPFEYGNEPWLESVDAKIYSALKRIGSDVNCAVLGISPDCEGHHELSILKNGEECGDTIDFWYIDDAKLFWAESGNIVQYHAKNM